MILSIVIAVYVTIVFLQTPIEAYLADLVDLYISYHQSPKSEWFKQE